MEELEEEGKENVAKYVEMQNKIINFNNEMKQKFIQQLTDLCQKLNQYFQKQQKFITSIIEQQNQKLSQNVNKANQLLNEQSVLDSQSIDNFIIFTTLNEENQQIIENKYTQINNCLERQFKYEFAEIQSRVHQFITMEFKFDSVPTYEVEQFKIQTVDKKKDQLPYCKEHQMDKNCICTHEDCLKEQKNEYICLGCAMNNHEQHYKRNFVKTLKKIKSEQSEKFKLIEEQNSMLKQEVENRIDQELAAHQQKQQEIFICSQTMRENLKLLEAQTKIDPFNQNLIYIYHSIDQNLLSYDSDMIKLEFQSRLNQLEQLKSNIATIKKDKFDQQYQNAQEQTQNFKQETFKLKKLLSQYETKILELEKQLYLIIYKYDKNNLTIKIIFKNAFNFCIKETSNESIIAELQKSQKCAIEESFQQYQNQKIELKNYIKSQVQSIQQNIVESKQITSLQSDLKMNIATINQIKQYMETIPKTVIESKQFQTMSQDLKNTQTAINSANYQIGTVAKVVIESKEFTTLQQDLKSTLLAINSANSQIGTVPKIVIESKEFTTLQQDLKNTLLAINSANSQIGTVPKVVIESKEFKTLQQDLKNTLSAINSANSQIGTVPKFVIESKEFTTLQQDLKSTLLAINSANSQIGTVPKFVIESKEFTTLQEDLKNTLSAINSANQQIGTVPKVVIESKEFKTLQQDLKNTLFAINSANQQIGTVPKFVIESKEFKTLQQDLKNTLLAINSANSQIGAVPKFVIESKEFKTLQQDLKNTLLAINSANQQIGTVPKFVIESKEFTTLQQDLKNTLLAINSTNSQIGTVPQVVIESKEFKTLQQDLKNAQQPIAQVNSQIEKVNNFNNEYKNYQVTNDPYQKYQPQSYKNDTLKLLLLIINYINDYYNYYYIFLLRRQKRNILSISHNPSITLLESNFIQEVRLRFLNRIKLSIIQFDAYRGRPYQYQESVLLNFEWINFKSYQYQYILFIGIKMKRISINFLECKNGFTKKLFFHSLFSKKQINYQNNFFLTATVRLTSIALTKILLATCLTKGYESIIFDIFIKRQIFLLQTPIFYPISIKNTIFLVCFYSKVYTLLIITFILVIYLKELILIKFGFLLKLLITYYMQKQIYQNPSHYYYMQLQTRFYIQTL